MANRREEERERLREAREAREKEQAKSDRRRLYLGYGAAGIIGIAVLVGIVLAVSSSVSENDGGKAHINVGSGSTNGIAPDLREGNEAPPVKVADLKEAAKKADCQVRLNLSDEGANHLPPTAKEPPYGTIPPTSGNHAEPPYQQADGAYIEPVKPLYYLHSTEHGRLAIQYSPDLDESAQLDVRGLYETLYAGALLFPNEEMPFEVAAVTWRNMLTCDEYKGPITLDAIRAFGKQTWDSGNEPANAFNLRGPTPKNPALN